MAAVRRLVLDVLKPRQPNIIEFASTLGDQCECRVQITVVEVDDQTETLRVVLEGERLSFERIDAAIRDFGGSLHSVDEVTAHGPVDS